jgi:hypothetical protein
MDYACHAYANAMQLRTKHLRCYKKGFGNAPLVLALAMPTAMTFIFVVIIAAVPMPGF